MSDNLLLCASMALAIAMVASASTSGPPEPDTALRQIRARYHGGLDAFGEATRALDSVADLPASRRTSADLRAAFAKTRDAYKAVEWLVAYYDEAAANRYLNGAPLPKVEQKVADLRVIEPAGLQALEEVLYGDPLDTAAARALADELAANAPAVIRDLRRRPVSAADVYAAARYGLVRVFALGVTGFDTPASDRALHESRVALAAIRAGVTPLLRTQRQLDASTRDSIERAFDSGLRRLTAGEDDFRGFDRVAFLRECVDPLYGALLTAHVASGAELPRERARRPRHHNYESRSVFATDFLNDFVFAGQPARDTLFSRKRDLGERLFGETALSASGEMSCATCHDPTRAFTDGHPRSLGADGVPLLRNAPTLLNAVYAERFFADLREPTLARQVRHVIREAHEFGTDYLTLLATLREREDYARAFDSAYADVAPAYRISTHTVSDALVSYVRTLKADDSPVDRYLRHETTALAPAVRRGFNLFMGEAACGTCHFAPTFAGLVPPFYRESESEVLGVPAAWPMTDATALDPDPGRAASGQPLDGVDFYVHSFKTPTVRNVAQTAPYMHNGAFATLGEVVAFYEAGGGAGLGLDVPHQTLPFDSLALDDGDRADLVAFMEALSDVGRATAQP